MLGGAPQNLKGASEQILSCVYAWREHQSLPDESQTAEAPERHRLSVWKSSPSIEDVSELGGRLRPGTEVDSIAGRLKTCIG